MSLNTKPTLSTIPAFDAEFGTAGKEHIEAPILKFSWRDGMARKNQVVIRDYDSNEIVYDCTITTMALKHQLHNALDSSEKIQVVTYGLQNGHKYIANVYVYTELEGERSLPSNDIIFYCFATPTFQFVNFDKYVSGSTEIAIVESNSINLRVQYVQADGEMLNNYQFKLLDYSGNELLQSDIRYSNVSQDVLRYTFGGVTETETDKYGNIQFNKGYIVVCSGETIHGMTVYAEQRFVVLLDNYGVGSLLIVTNVGDGTVSITSNYRIINSRYSGDEPLYETDENGNPYAINLNNGEYVEFIDGFLMRHPYEVVFKGKFNLGELVRFENSDGQTASINICEYKLTEPILYYANFIIEIGNVVHEVRTGYWESTTNMSDNDIIIDFSCKNNFYNIKAKVNGEVY